LAQATAAAAYITSHEQLHCIQSLGFILAE
jgi:hypothetical protein